MSIRRAVESNFKQRLETALAGTKYTVVEALNFDDGTERPTPFVLVIAGQATSALENYPDPLGNYMVDLSVVIESNVDVCTVDEHTDAAQTVARTMADLDVRRKAVTQGLHLYDTIKLNDGSGNEDRKMGTGLNFKVVCCYAP